MRPFLTLLVWTGPLMLNQVGCFSEATVSENRKHGDVSAGIVGDEYKSSGGIYDYMTRRAAKRGALIQQSEIPGASIDGKCAQGSRRLSGEFGCFVNRIQVAVFSIHGEE